MLAVSGLLVHIPGRGYVLLDAGEGTWGQLCRFFGTDVNQPNNVWDVLRELRCVFISHAHADHHAGLAKILSMRRQVCLATPEPLHDDHLTCSIALTSANGTVISRISVRNPPISP
jgi:ribonuclease Z